MMAADAAMNSTQPLIPFASERRLNIATSRLALYSASLAFSKATSVARSAVAARCSSACRILSSPASCVDACLAAELGPRAAGSFAVLTDGNSKCWSHRSWQAAVRVELEGGEKSNRIQEFRCLDHRRVSASPRASHFGRQDPVASLTSGRERLWRSKPRAARSLPDQWFRRCHLWRRQWRLDWSNWRFEPRHVRLRLQRRKRPLTSKVDNIWSYAWLHH